MRRAGTVLAYFRWLARTTGAAVFRHGRIYPRPPSLEGFSDEGLGDQIGPGSRNLRCMHILKF